MGVGYAYVFPLVMGGCILPISGYFLDQFNGVISVPELLLLNADLFTGRWIFLAVLLGVQLLYVGVFAGVAFCLGAWLIDRFNASAHPATARYGSWAMALALSVIVTVVAAFTPETTFSRLV
jgi:hypothetical protein